MCKDGGMDQGVAFASQETRSRVRIGISTPRGSEGIGLCRHQNSDFRAMKDYLCYVSLLVCATEFKKAPKTSEIKKKCNSLMKYFVIKD